MGAHFRNSDVQPLPAKAAGGSSSASAGGPAATRRRHNNRRAEQVERTMDQLAHASPKLRDLQRQAEQDGWSVKLVPLKGKGSGKTDKGSGKGSGTSAPAASKPQPLVR